MLPIRLVKVPKVGDAVNVTVLSGPPVVGVVAAMLSDVAHVRFPSGSDQHVFEWQCNHLVDAAAVATGGLAVGDAVVVVGGVHDRRHATVHSIADGVARARLPEAEVVSSRVSPAPAAPPAASVRRPKRTLADLEGTAVESMVAGQSKECRVLNPSHALYMMQVRLLAHTPAGVVVQPITGGGLHTVQLSDVECFAATPNSVPSGVAAAASAEAFAFKTGDLVKICTGQYASQFKGVYPVKAPRGDDRYEVSLTEHGNVIFQGDELRAAGPNPFGTRVVSRPSEPYAIPSSFGWSPSQRTALSAALVEHRNVYLTGPPGGGKTEIGAAVVSSFLAHKQGILIVCLSNSIKDEVARRYSAAGVKMAFKVVGTFSSKIWVSLGKSTSWENLHTLVRTILTERFTQEVRENIWQASLIVWEEDGTTLPHFKDIVFALISLVCGYSGAAPAADKQFLICSDPRQLGGIQVEDGERAGSLNYAIDRKAGEEPKEVWAYESQVVQAFYPKQSVEIAVAHYSTADRPAPDDRLGTVLMYCSLRSKYAISIASGASEHYVDREEAIVSVEFVDGSHLLAIGCTKACFVDVHLQSGSFRVRSVDTYDETVPARNQSAAAVMVENIAQCYNGNTRHPSVCEAIRRMRYHGPRFFLERPEWYESTYHQFSWNKPLEKFARDEHVAKFRVPQEYLELEEAGTIFTSTAIKVLPDGVTPLSELLRCNWDGHDGDRQRVAGATACFLVFKLGYPLAVGTYPQIENEGAPKRSARIPVEKLKETYLQPMMRVVPVAVMEVPCPLIGIETEYHVIVECLDIQDKDGMFARATIKPLDYVSTAYAERRCYWRQLPLKFLMLRTINSLLTKGCVRTLLHLDFIWLYNQVFTAMTRAIHPPPPVGASLAGLAGAIGIVVLTGNHDGKEMFDPTSVFLGLPPKVALRWSERYGRPVPAEALAYAQEWTASHIRMHLKQESLELTLRKARALRSSQPPVVGGSAAGASTSAGASSSGASPSVRCAHSFDFD